MNHKEWERMIKKRTSKEGEKFSFRSNPSIGYDRVEERFRTIQLYPNAFLQGIKQMFLTAHVRDIEYKISDTENRSSETFYASVSVNGIDIIFRIWANHSEQSMSFHYIDSPKENSEFKRAVFQLYSLCKDFLENHSPNRLFFSTQSYDLSVPDFFFDLADNAQGS